MQRLIIATCKLVSAIAAVAIAAVAFCCVWAPQDAHAEVRKADVIAGVSVEDRGLTIAECPSIDAEYAVLVDQDGTVYFGRNADDSSRIASITKVMTAIVAIENAPDGLFIAVSEGAAEVGESSANLQQGDVMDLDAALKALLVPSGNDAAVALAESVGASMIAADPSLGNDPMTVFVDAMNKKAEELGCTNTIYENPHGLDHEQYDGQLHSSAADQAKVAQYAMQNPQIREIVGGGSTTIMVDRDGSRVEVELETTDELLDMYEYAIGIKTGVTDSAGPSFMGAASKEGRELYAVVLGSSDEAQRFVDTKRLFEWAYDHCLQLNLANSSEWSTMSVDGANRDVPVIVEVSHADWIDRTVPATFSDPSAVVEVFDFEGNVSQSLSFEELHGTIHEGDKVGTVVFKQRNQVIAEQDLIACDTVEGPNPIDTIAIWWQRVTTGATSADTQVYNVMPIINNNKAAA